ncbi:YdeI/OmpD-associated family protein [Nocardioides marmoribigeumensis]|jgi:uncharacterized protein YdeI (YjbR/CyaY-like superfamily)|nr:YdeI/OmpD-associated family protein [Nocardioides marmoribigeumensis]
MDEAERLEPATVDEWSAWLAEHHASTPGVWLVSARRAADRAFGYEEAVVEALRWGWVDSTQRGVDERRSMLWFSPRRPGSVWTRNNKQRVARLEAEGRMEPAGRAQVEAARASGTWTLMDDVEDLVVPADLAEAFESRPGSREHFDAFSPSVRRQVLAWIVLAKKAETRAARVAATAEQAAAGKPARS